MLEILKIKLNPKIKIKEKLIFKMMRMMTLIATMTTKTLRSNNIKTLSTI